MGNCGFTIAPCRPGDRELILKNLTQVEGMSLEALLAGTKTGYETFDEYMALLESGGVVPNVAVYCGHSSIRNWVMGADDWSAKPPMKRLTPCVKLSANRSGLAPSGSRPRRLRA